MQISALHLIFASTQTSTKMEKLTTCTNTNDLRMKLLYSVHAEYHTEKADHLQGIIAKEHGDQLLLAIHYPRKAKDGEADNSGAKRLMCIKVGATIEIVGLRPTCYSGLTGRRDSPAAS